MILTGCFSAQGTVEARAAYDFNCPEDDVTVTNVSGTTYAASGCGRKALYVCNQDDSMTDDIACVVDGRLPPGERR